MSMDEPGLRERKKQRTRELLAETARRLFCERGFEHVSVADVARAAEVSPATVFNYFASKEDLVYGRLEAFEAELLAAVRDRAPGETALAAFARFVLEPRGLLATDDEAAAEELARIVKMIAASPALLARERQIFAGYTDSLAALIAEETGAAPDAVEPWVAANALMGVHRRLVDYTRGRIVAGDSHSRLARDVLAEADRALARLDDGLAEYAVREA
jgi:AcrR family transcriptional regulator